MRSVNSCRSTKAWSTARFSSSLGGQGQSHAQKGVWRGGRGSGQEAKEWGGCAPSSAQRLPLQPVKVLAKPPSQAWHQGRDTQKALGRTVCLESTGVAGPLFSGEKCSKHVLCWPSPLSDETQVPQMPCGDGPPSPIGPWTIPVHHRCPQNDPHNARHPDHLHAVQMSTVNPQKSRGDPQTPQTVPMHPRCPQTVSVLQTSRKFHTP